MATDKFENRFYTFSPSAEKRENGLAHLSGMPIVFNSPADIGGMFREVVMPGALTPDSLKDVPLLVNHNGQMIPIARSRRNNGNSTMQLSVMESGLQFDADIDIVRNATAMELYSAVDRKDLDGMSFAFLVADERWEGLDTEYPTRYINRFEVVREISVVTFPAYRTTSIDARSKEALDNARLELENAREQRAKEVETSDELALLKAKISLF